MKWAFEVDLEQNSTYFYPDAKSTISYLKNNNCFIDLYHMDFSTFWTQENIEEDGD